VRTENGIAIGGVLEGADPPRGSIGDGVSYDTAQRLSHASGGRIPVCTINRLAGQKLTIRPNAWMLAN